MDELRSCSSRGRARGTVRRFRHVGYDFGVGRGAPTFTLAAPSTATDQAQSVPGDWFAVLAFIRTQSPARIEALGQLSKAAGTPGAPRPLVGICDAGRDECVSLAAGCTGLAFPLLPDDGSVARTCGALRADGTARPMAFIIDRAGKIVWTGDGAAALTTQTLLAAFRQVVR